MPVEGIANRGFVDLLLGCEDHDPRVFSSFL